MPTTPFVPAPATMLCELRYTALNQKVENTLWVRDTEDSISTSKMSILGAKLILWWTETLKLLTSSSVTLEEVTVTEMNSDTSPSISVVSGAVGSVANAIMPLNVTVTTTFKTSGRGRSSRGRNYFVGLCENQCTGNQVEALVVDDIRDSYAVLPGYFIDEISTFEHVVVSKREDNAWREVALVQKVLSYVSHDNNVDSQRRRLTGRGL